MRAQDIIREVVRQLNSLRRQAAKARRYGRLREEMRSIQRLRIGMEERQLRAKLSECSTRFAQAQEQEGQFAYCRADVQRLCQGVQPGGGRLMQCLKAHENDLTVGCAKELQSIKARMGK